MKKKVKKNYGRDQPGYKEKVLKRSRDRIENKKREQEEFLTMYVGFSREGDKISS